MIRHFYIFIFLSIALCFSVHASKIDSLNIFIKKNTFDSNEVKAYCYLAEAYYKINPDSALVLSNAAYKLAHIIGYKKGEADGLKCIGLSYKYLGQDYNALKYYQDAIFVYSDINNAKGIGNCHNLIGSIYFSLTNYNAAIFNFNRAISFLVIVNDKEDLYNAYNNLAATYYNEEVYDKAADYYLKALLTKESLNDKKTVSTNSSNISGLYDKESAYKKDLEKYAKSLKASEKINDKEAISSNLNQIGTIYYSLEDYDRALDFQKKALTLYSELKDDKNKVKSLNNIGNIYSKQKKYDSSLYVHYKALELTQKSGNKNSISSNFISISKIYKLKHNYDSSYQYLIKALSIKEAQHDKIAEANILLNLAELFIEQNNYSKALSYAEKAFSIANDQKAKPEIINATGILYTIYKNSNNYQKALYFHELNKLFKDSVVNAYKSAEIGRLAAKYEYDKKEEKYLLEQLKTDLLNKNEITTQRYLIITFSLSTAILLLIVFIVYNSKKQKQKEYKILHEKNIEIENQSHELLELNVLKNKLFSIIAHDLRTPFANSIDMLNLLDNGTISYEEFNSFLPALTNNIKSGSNLLDNLLAWAKSQMEGEKMEIEKFDFREVILHKIDVFEKNATDKGILLLNNITGLCNVMADKNMIDLVVRNLVANAIKFCNKNDTITITSEIINDKLQVCIKDTGRGIEQKNIPKLFGNEMFSTYGTANEKGSGLGLMLCKDFVEKNNGKIWVESEFGEGSKFCFTIPLA